MKRMLMSAFVFALLLGNMGNGTVYAKQPAVPYKAQSNATPYANKYKWVYNTVDGVLYRRLYDMTNQCWVGDWEPCP